MNVKGFGLYALAIVALVIVEPSCAATRGYNASAETLVLLDGTKIPCRVLEITEQNVMIEALNPNDAYQFGDMIPRGQIKGIQVVKGRRSLLLTVEEYLKLHVDQFEEVTEAAPENRVQPQESEVRELQPERPVGHITERETTEQNRAQGESSSRPTQDTGEPEGPGLRFRSLVADTLPAYRSKAGLGLRLPAPPPPPSLMPPPDFADLAEFIVMSGSAGLILYRAEKFAEEGLRLSKARQELVNAIRASQMWRSRKMGLRRAHQIAASAFKEKYQELASELKAAFNFRAVRSGDPFVQFVIFLHTHGNLSSPGQRKKIRLWFGREAEQALVDILANFDDWYYIAVVSARSLKL